MLRASAIIPILLSIAAFILSLLIVLSGKDRHFLNDVYILKIDTSDIASNTSIDSVLDSAGIDIDTGSDTIDNLVDRVTGYDFGDLIDSAAHKVGLHDFYVAHVSTWCEGTLVADNSSSNSNDTSEEVTKCTSPKFPFSFDPVNIMEEELLAGITLDDLGFPTEDVNDVIGALEGVYRAMNMCYLIGTILAGVSILVALAGFFASRLIETLGGLIALITFLLLGIASAISTAVAVKGKNVFNDKAEPIGVTASNSSKFLGMTWAAVVCMFLVTIVWFSTCCCGTHHRRARTRKGEVAAEPMAEPRRGGFMSRFRRPRY